MLRCVKNAARQVESISGLWVIWLYVMPVTPKYILEKVLDLLLDTVCVVDAEGCFVYTSASCEQLLGYTADELSGRNIAEFILPADRERTLAAAAAVMEGHSHVHFENRYVHKDGRIVDIMWSARWSEELQLRYAVARDITELKYAERKQRVLYEISEAAQSAESMAALYQSIQHIIAGLLPSDLFFVAEYHGADNMLCFPCINASSPAVAEAKMQALDADSRLGRVIHSARALMLNGQTLNRESPDFAQLENYHAWLGVPLLSRRKVIGALVLARCEQRMAYTERDRELLQFVSAQIVAAIERKHSEDRLQHIASHDTLTDLPNRMLFQDRLEMAIKRANRDQQKMALLYLDLNGFKEINDHFGHPVGDLFLCEMARRLRSCVRETDTVARMGGDEFAVIITNVQGLACAEVTMQKIRAAIECPFELAEHSLSASASIGAALYPDQGETVEQLVRYADMRMYQAKPH